MGPQYFMQREGHMPPVLVQLPVGKSTYIRQGDLVILTNVIGRAGTGNRVLRPVYSADVASLDTNGVAGVAMYSIATDSDGNILPRNIGDSTITRTGPQVSYNFLTPNQGYRDPITGFNLVTVIAWLPENRFIVPIQADDPLSDIRIGQSYTFDVGSTAIALNDPVPLVHTLNADSTTDLICTALGIVQDPNYQTTTAGKGYVIVQPKEGTYQVNTGAVFTT